MNTKECTLNLYLDSPATITIDLYELFDELPDESKDKIAKAITWKSIMKEAVARLLQESENYSNPDDSLLTVEVLTKMEKRLLSGYKWRILRQLEQLAKNIISHEFIYWKMYHDPVHAEFFQSWLNRNNIESNYSPKFANYQEFRTMVEDKLEEFGNQIKDND